MLRLEEYIPSVVAGLQKFFSKKFQLPEGVIVGFKSKNKFGDPPQNATFGRKTDN
jgi:hypothetical protein